MIIELLEREVVLEEKHKFLIKKLEDLFKQEKVLLESIILSDEIQRGNVLKHLFNRLGEVIFREGQGAFFRRIPADRIELDGITSKIYSKFSDSILLAIKASGLSDDEIVSGEIRERGILVYELVNRLLLRSLSSHASSDERQKLFTIAENFISYIANNSYLLDAGIMQKFRDGTNLGQPYQVFHEFFNLSSNLLKTIKNAIDLLELFSKPVEVFNSIQNLYLEKNLLIIKRQLAIRLNPCLGGVGKANLDLRFVNLFLDKCEMIFIQDCKEIDKNVKKEFLDKKDSKFGAERESLIKKYANSEEEILLHLYSLKYETENLSQLFSELSAQAKIMGWFLHLKNGIDIAALENLLKKHSEKCEDILNWNKRPFSNDDNARAFNLLTTCNSVLSQKFDLKKSNLSNLDDPELLKIVYDIYEGTIGSINMFALKAGLQKNLIRTDILSFLDPKNISPKEEKKGKEFDEVCAVCKQKLTSVDSLVQCEELPDNYFHNKCLDEHFANYIIAPHSKPETLMETQLTPLDPSVILPSAICPLSKQKGKKIDKPIKVSDGTIYQLADFQKYIQKSKTILGGKVVSKKKIQIAPQSLAILHKFLSANDELNKKRFLEVQQKCIMSFEEMLQNMFFSLQKHILDLSKNIERDSFLKELNPTVGTSEEIIYCLKDKKTWVETTFIVPMESNQSMRQNYTLPTLVPSAGGAVVAGTFTFFTQSAEALNMAGAFATVGGAMFITGTACAIVGIAINFYINECAGALSVSIRNAWSTICNKKLESDKDWIKSMKDAQAALYQEFHDSYVSSSIRHYLNTNGEYALAYLLLAEIGMFLYSKNERDEKINEYTYFLKAYEYAKKKDVQDKGLAAIALLGMIKLLNNSTYPLKKTNETQGVATPNEKSKLRNAEFIKLNLDYREFGQHHVNDMLHAIGNAMSICKKIVYGKSKDSSEKITQILKADISSLQFFEPNGPITLTMMNFMKAMLFIMSPKEEEADKPTKLNSNIRMAVEKLRESWDMIKTFNFLKTNNQVYSEVIKEICQFTYQAIRECKNSQKYSFPDIITDEWITELHAHLGSPRENLIFIILPFADPSMISNIKTHNRSNSHSQLFPYNDTRGDGSCFFHAAFGQKGNNGEYFSHEHQNFRNQWAKYLSKFCSLSDPKVPEYIKNCIRPVFNLHLLRENDSINYHLFQIPEVEALRQQTQNRIENARILANQLKEYLTSLFFSKDDLPVKLVHVVILKNIINAAEKKGLHNIVREICSILDVKQISEINAIKQIADHHKELVNLFSKPELRTGILPNIISADFQKYITEMCNKKQLNSQAGKNPIDLKTYNEFLVSEYIEKSFTDSTIVYNAYLKVIVQQNYYVLSEEIQLLSSLNNKKINLWRRNRGQLEQISFEPHPQREIWFKEKKEKSEVDIYHEGLHYSNANREVLLKKLSSNSSTSNDGSPSKPSIPNVNLNNSGYSQCSSSSSSSSVHFYCASSSSSSPGSSVNIGVAAMSKPLAKK